MSKPLKCAGLPAPTGQRLAGTVAALWIKPNRSTPEERGGGLWHAVCPLHRGGNHQPGQRPPGRQDAPVHRALKGWNPL